MDLKKEDLYTSLLEGGEKTKIQDDGESSELNEEETKISKGEDVSCFTKMGKSCFSYMFPAAPKHAYTVQGEWLRVLLMCATFAHICLIVFSLAMVGYTSFLCNGLLFILAFSSALTLRTPTLVMYQVALLGVIVYDVFYGLTAKPPPNQSIDIQKFGLLIVAAFYLLIGVFVGKAFFAFKGKGGIKGNQEDSDDVGDEWELITDQDFANILQAKRAREERKRRRSTVRKVVTQQKEAEAAKRGSKIDYKKEEEKLTDGDAA